MAKRERFSRRAGGGGVIDRFSDPAEKDNALAWMFLRGLLGAYHQVRIAWMVESIFYSPQMWSDHAEMGLRYRRNNITSSRSP